MSLENLFEVAVAVAVTLTVVVYGVAILNAGKSRRRDQSREIERFVAAIRRTANTAGSGTPKAPAE